MVVYLTGRAPRSQSVGAEILNPTAEVAEVRRAAAAGWGSVIFCWPPLFADGVGNGGINMVVLLN